MTITRAQLAQAAALQNEYDRITAALAILAGPNPQVIISIDGDNSAGIQLPLANVPNGLVNMLTNRQAAITTILTGFGLTS